MYGLLSVVPTTSPQHLVGYPSLFLLVTLGSLVPVVPTGALVSTAAAVALHTMPALTLPLVFVVAALAAFLGDIALYWLGLRGVVHSDSGSRWLERLRERAAPDKLESAQRKLEEKGSTILVVSRLVPAGRIPVMVACLLGEVPMRTFIRGDILACLAWAATYQVIGVTGGALFAEPWQGALAAVVLTMAIGAAPAGWRRVRAATRRLSAS
ncbi:DedA family protein [Streptomyces zingiberis]|uniref:DedA family protein n=1 Tax=Streptomyces zingiberis TaxID=2053010 RepID=A0ABX1BYU2_9ACTN|nr:VTT domain-containing protein [Streptomyces zingiberis]NJQ02867.1 DedA family protein [Streptomyces zingiberis]